MTPETWLAFAAATTLLVIIPGPTVLLVMSYGLGQGWRAALPVAIGVALGDFTAMTLSLIGIGALLLTSALLFTALKWIGAAYLIYLGIRLFRAGGQFQVAPANQRRAALRMTAHAWLVTALNPKGITFFVAFVPQFIDPAGDFIHQVAIFEATFLVIAFASALSYGYFASRARHLVSSPRAVAIFNRTGGSLLIGAGIAAVSYKAA